MKKNIILASDSYKLGHYNMYPTIQQGIDNASDGDTVVVYTEDYYETIVAGILHWHRL